MEGKRPTLLPLAGLYPLIENDYPMKSWTRLYEKYGGMVGFVMGNNHGVLVSGWESVKDVLNHEDCQGRPDVCLVRDRFDGDNYGVVFTDGAHWRVQRRFTLHHFRNLGFGRQSHESVIEDEALALVQNIGSEKGKPLMLLDRVAGCRYPHESPIMKKLAKNIEESLHDIQVTGSVAVAIPFLRYIFPESTGYASVKRGSKGVQEFTKMVIADHKKDFDPEKPRDFIDIYLNELNNNKGIDASFTTEQLEALCMDLLTAGTDTTSNTITFAIMYLSMYPEIQARIHKELDEVVGRDRYPTVRDRPNLVYTDATLMEVLRMRGPLPIMIPHRVTKDATVCGFNLPNDTLLLINVFSVQMDKKYWGDPEHFRPERFISPENKIRKEERLIPFGKEPNPSRECLKNNNAMRLKSLITTKSVEQI
ncbi:hypothetical protein Avbf_13578 [Armadillidium vulgare]|nr:hypothetical protein Avbf_13578 [Armadillidium vulgare]